MSDPAASFSFENVWDAKSEPLKDEVVQFWLAHNALPLAEAQRRVHEVVMVVREPQGRLVAVSTAARGFNPVIGSDCYYYRAFVAPAWRRTGLARALTIRVRDFFDERFDSRDPRAPIGLFVVVENPHLKAMNLAVWPEGFVFVGRSAEGHHLRVYYFHDARIQP